MALFRSKAQKELDYILAELKNYLSNNYKDPAQECRRKLGEKSEQYYRAGKLNDRQYRYYQNLFRQYTAQMKDYHH